MKLILALFFAWTLVGCATSATTQVTNSESKAAYAAVVKVAKDGSLATSTGPITLAKLSALAASEAAKNPQARFYIDGEADVTDSQYAVVLGACVDAGISNFEMSAGDAKTLSILMRYVENRQK